MTNPTEAIRGADSGASGALGDAIPLLTTLGAAWVILWLVPILFASPLGILVRFQPDMGLALIATAVSGVLWSVFRLGVAYLPASPARPDR